MYFGEIYERNNLSKHDTFGSIKLACISTGFIFAK